MTTSTKSPSRNRGLATTRTIRSSAENRVQNGSASQVAGLRLLRSTSSGTRGIRGASSRSRRTPPLCTATDTTPAPFSSCPAMVLDTVRDGAASTASEASSAARTRSMNRAS